MNISKFEINPKFQSNNETLAYIYPLQKIEPFGNTLEINFFGSQKICSYDCLYCNLGPTQIRMNMIKKDLNFVNPSELLDKLISEISNLNLVQHNSEIDTILFSGNGEPTIYPHTVEFLELLTSSFEKLNLNPKLRLLTNGVHFDQKKVQNFAQKLDEVILKVDSGSDELLKKINRPLVRANIQKLISASRSFDNLSVQSMFVHGMIDNTQHSDIEEWMEVVGMIQPKMTYLTSMTQIPAYDGIKKVDEDTLYVIASKLKRRTQLESLVLN